MAKKVGKKVCHPTWKGGGRERRLFIDLGKRERKKVHLRNSRKASSCPAKHLFIRQVGERERERERIDNPPDFADMQKDKCLFLAVR